MEVRHYQVVTYITQYHTYRYWLRNNVVIPLSRLNIPII